MPALIKWRSKVDLDQWKLFSENYKPMRVWLWFVYKITGPNCCSRHFAEFIQTQEVSYIFWQNHCFNLMTQIKSKLFL